MGGLGIHLNFSLHDPSDKVTTRDAHCGHHNEHLKILATARHIFLASPEENILIVFSLFFVFLNFGTQYFLLTKLYLNLYMDIK